jgi:hypothetical protein
MVDWLAAWGVSELGGFLLKDVFAPLVKGALEDYTKDFFKDCISDFSDIAKPEPLKKVVGKALKEFLILVQDELLTWDKSKADIRDQYGAALKKFGVAEGVMLDLVQWRYEMSSMSHNSNR